MTCFLINGSFVVAMLLMVPGALLGGRAQRHRVTDAPPRRSWRDGWDLFRPELFTERGNQLRRIGLRLSWIGAVYILTYVTLIFSLRAASMGTCSFQLCAHCSPA